ncbi:MAG TPA: STAS domain-containing protein [Streptosporangiaceae bacterium]|jgi:anti-sigma B factor antagonist|nr:STAS domain-containing protein [Streptosporangiaceae bacterium]
MRKLLEANVVDCLEYRILVLVGEIDLSVGESLLARIVGLLRGGEVPLLIDMTGVRFCDSTGLNVAVEAKRHADACGCTLVFFGLSERVEKLFRITAIDRLVRTYPTLNEAAAAVTNPITATRGSAGDRQKPTPRGGD